MEFRTPYLVWVGAIAALMWSLDYWKIFVRSPLFFPMQTNTKTWLKKILRVALFLVGIVGWANLSYSLMQPRKAQKFSPSNIEVNDVIICIDVSRSMLAEDIKPNRLEVAKERIREFVRMRPTDRISVVIFSEKVKDAAKDEKNIVVITDIRYDEFAEDEVDWVKKELNGFFVHISKYTEDKGVKVFGLPPNEDEAINNPKLIEKADYLIQWPDKLKEEQAKRYCNEVLIYIRLSEIYNSIKK